MQTSGILVYPVLDVVVGALRPGLGQVALGAAAGRRLGRPHGDNRQQPGGRNRRGGQRHHGQVRCIEKVMQQRLIGHIAFCSTI